MTPSAYALVDKDAVRHNLSIVRGRAPQSKVLAVVKANGYGHGLLRIAEALQRTDGFAVARVDEGIVLREAGFAQRIVVLQGFSCVEELQILMRHQLEAVVHTVKQVELLEDMQRDEIVADGQCTVWLKLDTGMHRLGFCSHEFLEAYLRLMACSVVKKPLQLMTHFANADDMGDQQTLNQIQRFNQAVEGLVGEHSMANSAAILAWSQSLGDWVRPGVMLFGISPFSHSTGRQLGLLPAMSLHSRVIAIKSIKNGDAVGYGGNWVCQQSTRLGVIAIGYGDGYPRHAKSGTPVLVNNAKVSLVGRVSMDMITVDLGNDSEVSVGDPVTLWGSPDLPIEEVAKWADTIPYTLVCGVTRRVQVIDKS